MKPMPFVVSCLALSVSVFAQGSTAPRQPPPDKRPMAAADGTVAGPRSIWETYKKYFTAAAAEMPEANYGFRPPTIPAADGKEIRTYGQIVAHIASESFMFCAAASGVAQPAGTETYEQTKTTKADITKALAEGYAYCDQVWSATNDANMNTPGKWPAQLSGLPGSTRLGILTFNTAHTAEHYGNLVTYLRAKGLVPPSSGGK